eukprot:CAMPEP_0198438076 /NCGR_PEP_ID=MMETSP1452-20131203/49552_1 /TAXON_ID=1181717 /ORGANISM="Synchroma pusillum, Strain CCMP3072" /LENGTH=102 /DNA_ID=CAMNT_0044158651 /DNA_START=17 /DNA_END=322 /DNA_ORIENTATION=-
MWRFVLAALRGRAVRGGCGPRAARLRHGRAVREVPRAPPLEHGHAPGGEQPPRLPRLGVVMEQLRQRRRPRHERVHPAAVRLLAAPPLREEVGAGLAQRQGQ